VRARAVSGTIAASFRPFVFHATIHRGADDPFHVTGQVTPYDLEVLREHLSRTGRQTRVRVRLAAGHRPAFLRALRGLEQRGIEFLLES
jgi:hypothetical protein